MQSCFQKTRPQNIDIWPNDGNLMPITDIFAELPKNLKISGIFEDFTCGYIEIL